MVPAAWLAVRWFETPWEDQRPIPRAQAALAAGAIALFAVALFAGREGGSDVVARDRNFYGTLTVAEYDRPGSEDWHRTMRPGRILHGLQYLHPKYERLATAYYGWPSSR